MPKGINYLPGFNTRGSKEKHIQTLDKRRHRLIQRQIGLKMQIGEFKRQLTCFGPDPPQGAKDAVNRLIQENFESIMRTIDYLQQIEEEIIRLQSL